MVLSNDVLLSRAVRPVSPTPPPTRMSTMPEALQICRRGSITGVREIHSYTFQLITALIHLCSKNLTNFKMLRIFQVAFKQEVLVS